MADIYVVNYDVLGKATKPKRRGEEWSIEWKPALFALKNRVAPFALKAVVFDEFHYCKNYQAQRSRLCRALAQGLDVRLGLTGTPVLNRPNEIVEPLQILGRLNDLGGFKSFMTRYCGWSEGVQGSGMGATALSELNERLRSTCYVRREKADVLTELPAKRRVRVPMELSNRSEYARAEAELIRWIGEEAAKDGRKRAEIIARGEEDGLTGDLLEAFVAAEMKSYVAEKMFKGMSAEALRRFEVLKQLSAKGKLDEAVEWLKNFTEGGEKIIVFGTHRDEVVEKIGAAMGWPTITGETPIEKRQAIVDQFQNDPDLRGVVLNIRAGGVGLTLTAASNVAFVELDWNPGTHDQAEDRVHRIGQRESVTAWYLLGAQTIDEEIAELIDEKRLVVDEATTGNAQSDKAGSILNALVASLGKRAGVESVSSAADWNAAIVEASLGADVAATVSTEPEFAF